MCIFWMMGFSTLVANTKSLGVVLSDLKSEALAEATEKFYLLNHNI